MGGGGNGEGTLNICSKARNLFKQLATLILFPTDTLCCRVVISIIWILNTNEENARRTQFGVAVRLLSQSRLIISLSFPIRFTPQEVDRDT